MIKVLACRRHSPKLDLSTSGERLGNKEGVVGDTGKVSSIGMLSLGGPHLAVVILGI